MKSIFHAPLFVVLLIVSVIVNSAMAQTNTVSLELQPSPLLQRAVDKAVQATLDKFTATKLATNQIAVTLVDLTDPNRPASGSHRGGEQVYPASVVKLFYMLAAHRWMEDGKLADTEELRRAMRDMIVDSYNEATGYIVDMLTDTTSGPELSDADMRVWIGKRNVVNRYLSSLGYKNINVNRKTWCEGPYGREMQSVKLHAPDHRNWLTTDATARLLAEIVTARAVTPERSRQMMDLLVRRPFDETADRQSREYVGPALPPGTKLWSKAGWTSEARHDAAYVELPGGRKLIMVIFTIGHAQEKEIVAFAARTLLDGTKE